MIYLDAAATTLEKPPQVRQGMAQAAAELSTPPLIAIANFSAIMLCPLIL